MKCYYCQHHLSPIHKNSQTLICNSCPVKIKHYYDWAFEDQLVCLQFEMEDYTFTVYFHPEVYEHNWKLRIAGKNQMLQFEEDFGLTIFNAKEKLKLLLTFQ